MPNILPKPLMSGTRLLLTVILFTFYIVAAFLALAAVALPILGFGPFIDGGLTVNDLIMLVSGTLYTAAVIVFFRLLRAIVISVERDAPFNHGNARRLEWMGWIWLAFWVAGIFFAFYDAMPNGLSGTIEFAEHLLPDLINDGLDIVVALTLFILARVFRHGAELRDDLEGTV